MKRIFVLDRLFLFFILFAVGFLGVAVMEWQAGSAYGFLFLFLFLLFLAGALLFPFLYRFDEKGVSIYRLCLPSERYRWKNVRSIYADQESGSVSATNIFSLFFNLVYTVDGQVEGKYRRYMEGHIRRGPLTRRAIGRYYDGEIEGTLAADIKQAIRRQRQKRQAREEREITADRAAITTYERELRAAVRRRLKPYVLRAEEMGLSLRRSFIYRTEDGDEFLERPNAAYTYSVELALSLPGEVDDDRILCLEAELLQQKRRARRIRYSVNEAAISALCHELAQALDDISQQGHSYFSNLQGAEQ